MLLREIRYAVRSLLHTKGFTIVGILCLGLGLGLNTAIFSILDGVLLKPYPYEDPDRIVSLETWRQRDDARDRVSIPDLRDWKAATTSFTTIAGLVEGSITITDDAGEPERYNGARVSWDLFRLLGVRPMLGRDFLETDDQPNAAGVAVISHLLWTTRYRSDPQVIGRGVTINGTAHTIVGVMPPGFAFPEMQQVWIAMQPTLFRDPRDRRYVQTFARLRDNLTTAPALDDLNAIAARLAREYPATNDGWRPRIRTLREAFLPADVPLIIGLMMAGVTLVLFIACSNIANLLLARATARRHELAMRVALGAGRGHLVLQLITEAVVLALVSVPLGVLVAAAGIRLIWTQIPPDTIPYYVQFTVDARSLVYAIALAFVTSLVFGLVPALQITRRELQENLKEGARGTTSRGAIVRNALVVSQVSLALVALVGALLFVRSFTNLETFRVGFETTSALTMRFFMTGEAYAMKGSKAQRVDDIVRRIEGLPGGASRLRLQSGANLGRRRRRDDRGRRARRQTTSRHLVHCRHAAHVLDARRCHEPGPELFGYGLEPVGGRRQRGDGKTPVAGCTRGRSAIQARDTWCGAGIDHGHRRCARSALVWHRPQQLAGADDGVCAVSVWRIREHRRHRASE